MKSCSWLHEAGMHASVYDKNVCNLVQGMMNFLTLFTVLLSCGSDAAGAGKILHSWWEEGKVEALEFVRMCVGETEAARPGSGLFSCTLAFLCGCLPKPGLPCSPPA
jgi:hypothetical protein